MHELWIDVDCFVTAFYDGKPVADILGNAKGDRAVTMTLTDSEYDNYMDYLKAHEYWQDRFKAVFDGKVDK